MNAEAQVVLDEIGRARRVLADIEGRLRRFLAHDLPRLGRSEIAAVFVARLATSYYTALETSLLRVSQYFENSLSKDRWHAATAHTTDRRIPSGEPFVRMLLPPLPLGLIFGSCLLASTTASSLGQGTMA